MVDDAGEVALAAAIGDLVDADRHEAGEAVLVEVLGDDAGDDLADGVPPDPQQPGDRRLGHLLRQPRHDVFEVAGVMGTRPGPRHRFGAHDAAVRAPEQPQLAFDHAARRAEIQVAPALDAVVMHGQARAGLPAARAHPAPAAQPHGHDHPLAGEADIDDRCSGQAEQPVECRGDAHVALLAGPLFSTTSSLAPGGGCASLRSAQRPQTSDRRRTRPRAGTSRRSGGYVTHNSTGDPFNAEHLNGREQGDRDLVRALMHRSEVLVVVGRFEDASADLARMEGLLEGALDEARAVRRGRRSRTCR